MESINSVVAPKKRGHEHLKKEKQTMIFQTRSEENGIKEFNTFDAALGEATQDKTVWKISFTIPKTNERIRLVRKDFDWVYEPILTE